MQVKKSLIAAMAVVALGAGALSTNAVLAAEEVNGPVNNLVSAIATRFNLNEEEVQAVFDAEHEEMRAEHEQKAEEHLAKLVTDGKLTQEQADLVLVQQEEHRVFMEGLKDLEGEERGAAMKAHREESRLWAEENDIPLGTLLRQDGGRHHGGRDGMHKRMMDDRKAE